MEKMIRCVEKAAEFTGLVCGIIDNTGKVLICSDDSLTNSDDHFAREFLLSGNDFAVSGRSCYRSFTDSLGNEYVCFMQGTDDHSQAYLNLLTGWVSESIYDANTEVNREALLKNILLENELPGDIPLKAREFKIPYAARRVALLVHLPHQTPMENLNDLRQLVNDQRTDFLLSMDESNVVVLKEIAAESYKQVEGLAKDILAAFKDADPESKISIGVGMPADTLRECAKSYREASLALTVGTIFDQETPIMYYDKLGLGRLIYQLPATLCYMFLDEVFPNDAYENLDSETLLTINKFFENNLNGSETARQLFVHRNTLVYRLDKVQKITNLDLRNFDDAVLFKLAAMVRQYLERQNGLNYDRANRWWQHN